MAKQNQKVTVPAVDFIISYLYIMSQIIKKKKLKFIFLRFSSFF